MQPMYIKALDMVNTSLFNDIRDAGITARELANIADIKDIDGPAQQMVEKLIAGLRLRKISAYEASQQLAEIGAIKVDLIDLACKSDFIVILCNLDSNTKGMIQSNFFSNMKKSAYIFNLSRGPVINESHLENALEAKEIAGAGLDVTEKEPLSTDSKLLKYENVIITPHALCWTDECFNDIATEAISSILNYVDKKPIFNQVNK